MIAFLSYTGAVRSTAGMRSYEEVRIVWCVRLRMGANLCVSHSKIPTRCAFKAYSTF